MRMIRLLDQNTIDKIAAGEVIERPAAVVKELVENAIDSGANAITIEIKQGGISFIRITDNGCGIPKDQIPLAFQRHATSKISTIEDLLQVKSLGFRGEALSSIAAVSQVELITKDADSIIGCRYEIHGGTEITNEEIGCPDGTTFIMRNLFYNTPARGKFLKTNATEGGYISDVVLHFILSHPEIRFKFIWDGKIKIQTSGNGNVKDNIYNQYGPDITKALLPVEVSQNGMTLTGFIGKPELSRGTRSFMNYYINGRHIKSPVIQKGIEAAYQGFTMTNRFPFTALFLKIDSSCLDVNVHPSKMEVRFTNQEEVFELFRTGLHEILKQATLIPKVSLGKDEPTKKAEKKLLEPPVRTPEIPKTPEPFETKRTAQTPVSTVTRKVPVVPVIKYEQQSLFQEQLLQEEDAVRFRLIGQVFGTFWLIEYKDELLIIDQHAAHEKVLYEELMKELSENHVYSQNLLAPVVLTLTHREKEVLVSYQEAFTTLGFEIEEFGGDEYAVKAVPSHFLHLASRELFYSILDELLENPQGGKTELITDRCASISCKAAVKGNHTLSFSEAEKLIEKMLRAEEPYHCPHGRPTTISMTKKEFEKKFKRIV
ncbi:MAG: DNA mismatch repair endonuclease MutL [Eubacterium sp.]|nr:DNA mismatch repair endonuclease MutL [Eubacterium sp.]